MHRDELPTAATLLSRAVFSLLEYTTPPLSAFLSYASIYTAQNMRCGSQHPALTLCSPGTPRRTSPQQAPARCSPPGTAPLLQPPPQASSVPRNRSLCTKKKIYLPVFEAPFKSNSDKDLFSLNMTGCWPCGYFGNKPGGSWPQISLALTGAGGDAEPFQGDHRTRKLTCF